MKEPAPGTTSSVRPDLSGALEHRRIAVLAALLGPVLLGTAGLVLAWFAREEALACAQGFVLLSGLVLLAVSRRLRLRIAAADAGEQSTRASGKLTSLLLGLLALGGAHLWAFPLEAPFDPSRIQLFVVAGLTALVLAVLARFYRETDARIVPEAPGIASWLTLGSLLSTLSLLALLVRGSGWAPFGLELEALGIEEVALHGGHLLLIGVAGELLLQALLARSRGRLACAMPVLVRLLGSRWNPVSSLFAYLTDAFGIDLRGTWALGFIQRSLVPIGLLVAVVAWLASAFVVVEAHERGVLETFGRVSDAADLEPGLHLVWPWPVQSVRRVSVDRVRSLPIGFQGEVEGASLLWTRQHAEQEYSLLLGDGRDVVAVNASLQYRVRSPREFLYANAEPERALAVVADRVLMRETVGRTLDGVLSENLAELSSQLQGGIQAEANGLGLGIEVVDLTLLGLHPPVMVAKDYQAVVSAQVLLETRVLEAEAYTSEALPRAEGRATERREEAQAEAVRNLARARGEASSFEGHLESYRDEPELYRFRRTLEAQETFLAEQPFVVLDHRLERDGATVILGAGSNNEQED